MIIAHNSQSKAGANCLLQEKLYPADTVGYRTSDFRYSWNEAEKMNFVLQATNYSFSSPEGILQYPLLPLNNVSIDGLGIGRTPLVPLCHISAQMDIDLLIKCEHQNPSGSFKDRETLIASLNSIEKGYHSAVGFSSGNACCSAAYIASMIGQPFIAIVSGDIYHEKLEYMSNRGVDVITIGDSKCSFEKAYQIFLRAKRNIEFELNGIDDWSVNNPYRVEGDKSIALEIIHQYERRVDGTFNVPDYVVLPTANGSCLSGVWKGFKELFDLGIILKTPRMVSIGIKNASPIFKSRHKDRLSKKVKCDLQFLDKRNSSIGSILIAEESYDLFNGHPAIKESEGFVYEGDADDIRYEYQQLFSLEMENLLANDLMPEPCSALSLTAVRKMKESGLLKSGDAVVVVFTGHARKSIGVHEEFSKHLPEYEYWAQKQRIQGANEEIDSALKGKVLSASEHHGNLEKVLLACI